MQKDFLFLASSPGKTANLKDPMILSSLYCDWDSGTTFPPVTVPHPLSVIRVYPPPWTAQTLGTLGAETSLQRLRGPHQHGTDMWTAAEETRCGAVSRRQVQAACAGLATQSDQRPVRTWGDWAEQDVGSPGNSRAQFSSSLQLIFSFPGDFSPYNFLFYFLCFK